MSSKPKPKPEDTEEDLETFEKLPEKKKDQLKDMDKSEKATGSEQVDVSKKIKNDAKDEAR